MSRPLQPGRMHAVSASRRRSARSRRRHRARGLRPRLAWAAGVLALARVARWQGADMRPLDLLQRLRQHGAITLAASSRPISGSGALPAEMMVTLQIAMWGTALAVVCAVPLGLLSRPTSCPPGSYQPVRRLMDACRAINEMVFAMLFIVAVGLGPFAGVLALVGPHHRHPGQALLRSGRGDRPAAGRGHPRHRRQRLEEIVYGVIPQVLPLWISYPLYRFESNVRSASVVGMVGAGGIGVVLWEIIRGFQYAETCAVLMMMVVIGQPDRPLVGAARRGLLIGGRGELHDGCGRRHRVVVADAWRTGLRRPAS